MKKLCRKFSPKPSPRALFILVNKPKQCNCMQEILLKRYFEKGLSETF